MSDSQQTETQANHHVLVHVQNGVFLGCAYGLAFFAGVESCGQTSAVSFPDQEQAWEMAMDLAMEPYGIDAADLEIHAVASGCWRDLAAAGLDVADMAANEARNATLSTVEETAAA